MKKGCKTCKYAEFPLTPSGRRKTNKCGKYTYVIPELALPICVTKPSFFRCAIWIDTGDDCPVYEVKL